MPERLYHLTSLYSQYKWPHYEKAIAVCPHLIRKEGITNLSHALYSTSYIGHERYLDHHAGEPVPKPGCSCGFYAQPTLEGVPVSSLLPTPQGQIELPMIYVAGSIRIWGKVVEAEHGWRAQFAYPERLFIVIPDNRTMDNVFKPRMEMFRQGLLDGYGVPVGYCQRDDFGNLTQALLD